MRSRPSPPRLFGIPATRAPILAVIRRGPTAWSHLGRWDVGAGRYEPGAWIRGHLYPQRCDLSPDGRWFAYFTLQGRARWGLGATYLAISRLPWLTALAAWRTGDTWTRGVHFVDDRSLWQLGPPDTGDVAPCRERFGLALSRAASFAVERRRGWTETAESPARAPDDLWDERRMDRLRLEKPRPGTAAGLRLEVHGWFAAFRGGRPGTAHQVGYDLVAPGERQPLPGVQWADWDAAGRLLVATTDGRVQVRDPEAGGTVRFEVNLAVLAPAPAPAPPEGLRW
jgi:hypothetical protein